MKKNISNTIAIVQARLGSTRLPGKVLLEIESKPVLLHIVNRLKRVLKVDDVIIATSSLKINSKIISFCKENDIKCFVGSEDNVLERYYQAALVYKPKSVIRITGDCPLLDSELINRLIDYYEENDFDYCGIATGAGVANKKSILRYPDGLDAEIFKFSVLERAYKNATTKLHLEHVTPYIWSNKKLFNLGVMYSETDYSSYRWTLDNIEDFDFIKWIYSKLYSKNNYFNMFDIIHLLKNNKEILIKNKHLIGKEGYEIFSK
ncbi:glycosyltransferase family protein [Flavobacteriaceae bacterium]|nr:glycosyltransferase family protein [Flavobacteriaceae bacterium]|tara:strand:+ start:89 stop:874 length:786 start_codon:yes stop_codon:yes gene_type:complete